MVTNDLLHLLQLQKDLWRWPRSRSALMVGAGFSLNSQPLPGVTSRFPTWSQLVRKMFDELYPIEATASKKDEEYRNQRFQGENYLRLASKYEAAFGYARLDTLIRDMNPDNDHTPGILHSKLLELPWVDVFTTNYDTLLERTDVSDRSYRTIAEFSELPGSLPPRIVKLHGSFTTAKRLIIAEEHYRKYPKEAAPFVNTVQQSLLENSFVLIGFSGDDPNFLAWTGWIRDELQDQHSAIYLVGPLNLTNTDRLLLHRRGVTPIDLCPMFSRDEHYESILWFLESLAKAAPQRPENWLERMPEKKFSSIEPLIIEIKDLPPTLPEVDQSLPEMSQEQLHRIVNVWVYERLSYPGWVVAPQSKRNTVWRSTSRWLSQFTKTLNQLSQIEKIICVRELVWRLNLVMFPLSQEWIAVFNDDLMDFYRSIKKTNFRCENFESDTLGKFSSSQVISAWLDVSLEVLREAREVYDDARWTDLSLVINEVLEARQEISERYTYEKLLKAAWDVQIDADSEELAAWQPPSSMPLAQMWKASLLTEVGEVQKAKALLDIALNNIRSSAKNKGNNIELLSLEGWCTYLISCVDMSIHDRRFESADFSQRWQELKAYDCNPWELRKELELPLNEPITQQIRNGKVTTIGFDHKETSSSRRFTDSNSSDRAAFAYLRHFEQVGIPMYCQGVNVVGKHLERALKVVQPYIGFWSPALMVRARQIKQITDGATFLSRPQVESMPEELARRINSWCLVIFERYTEKYYISNHQKILKNRLMADLPEIVSRLSFKLSPEELDYSFRLALKIYSSLANLSTPAINGVCHKWLTRIYEAADDQQLINWLPSLLKAPFREVEGNMARDRIGWIDPLSNFPALRILIKTRSSVSPELKESIEWLYRKSQSLYGESRTSAIWRLVTLNTASLLDKNDIRKLRELLWVGVAKDSLPADLHPFNYLHLPKRNERDFFDLFKKHLLNTPLTSALMEKNGKFVLTSEYEFPSKRLKDISISSKAPVQLINEMRGLVIWTPEEVIALFNETAIWWDTIKAASPRFDEVHRSGSRWLADFILRLVGTAAANLPIEFIQRVYNWVIELRQYKIYADSALSILYFCLPDEETEIEKLLLLDIDGQSENEVYSAIIAIQYFYALSQAQSKPISSTLLYKLIYRVSFRSTTEMSNAVERLSFLIMQFPGAFDENMINLLSNSLTAWLEAVSLSVDDDADGIQKLARPGLQAAVGTLAGAISAWLVKNKIDLKRHPGVGIWRDACKQSCLPEIRRAFENGVQRSLKKNQ